MRHRAGGGPVEGAPEGRRLLQTNDWLTPAGGGPIGGPQGSRIRLLQTD